MPIPIYQVDAFTDEAFKGNPAAVCFLSKPRDADWMQNLAAEMNLSETAFLHEDDGGTRLRWFTPSAEVDLCGHATLASAHVLWESGRLGAQDAARFQTRSGELTAQRKGQWIELNFPAQPPEEESDSKKELEEALGTRIVHAGFNGTDFLAEVESADVVRKLQPDLKRVAALPARGCAATSRSDTGEFDFVSRFFAPGIGVNEDPVTGSAHCCLGPYWGGKLGKTEMTAYQASRRGGVVKVRLENDRVVLGGKAVVVFSGELKI